MAVFEARKGFHFSDDGKFSGATRTEDTTWAHFTRVPKSDPVLYRFETGDPKVIERLSVVDGVVRVDEPPVDEPRGPGRPRKVSE